MHSRVESRRNAVWVFGDQHRGQALGCHGDPNLHTPNVDRLAAVGLDFPRAVAGFPLCCPFRGSLLTGRYPHHCIPGHEYPMPDGQQTIAHVFRENGYETAYFGKWHCDGWKERDGRAAMHTVPRARRGGFDLWLGYENNNSPWDSWIHGHGRDGKEHPHERLPTFETDALTDLLIEWIRDQARRQREGCGRPFFAVLSVQPPHNPCIAPTEWMGRHTPGELRLRPNVPNVASVEARARRELAGYYAQIENLDWNLGRIRDTLAAEGLLDDTHLIFFSDHGDMMGSHGHFRKTTPYAESIDIPLIIGGLRDLYDGRGGRAENVLVNHVDMAPTTLGLCGIRPPDWMEGTDYSSLRRGGEPPEIPDSAYLQCIIPTGHAESVNRPWRGLVTRDGWKYVCFERVPFLLFNLNEDPYEQVNLAHNNRYRTERRRLQERLAQWIADTGDRFDLPEEV